jgi:hypothetical protein
MLRLLRFLVVAFVLAPATFALAQTPLVLEAQALAVKPGTDVTLSLQAAVDALAARLKLVPPGIATKGILHVAADVSAYSLARSIHLDADGIEVRGDGNGTRFALVPDTQVPLFLVGIKRWAGTPAAYAAYRPDLFGRLDLAAVPAAGRRWGWASGGDSFLQATASPLNAGGSLHDGSPGVDNFARGQALTVEFALDGHGPLPAGIFGGIGTAGNWAPLPYLFYTDRPDHINFMIGTQSVPFAAIKGGWIGFSLPPAAGTRRVAVQVDLAAGKIGAYVDGLLAPLDFNNLSLLPSATLRFAENDFYPFLFGDTGGARASFAPSKVAFDVLGFTVSRSLRYAWGVAGTAQTRLDGKPIDDTYRYFTKWGDDAGHLASFAFNEAIATCTRQLNVQGGPASKKGTSQALLLHSTMTSGGSLVQGVAVRDCQLQGGWQYGSNLGLGFVLDVTVERVKSRQAYYGISTIQGGAVYPINLRDLDLDGSDSSLFLQSAIASIRDVRGNGGRVAARFAGCNIDAANWITPFVGTNSQAAIQIHAGDYGGEYSIRKWMCDNEGGAYAHAGVVAEAHPYGQTTLRITDMYMGTTGPASVPLIKLMAPTRLAPATLVVDHLDAARVVGKAVVDSDGWWAGEVTHSPGIVPLVKTAVGQAVGVLVVPTGPVAP